MGLQCSILGHSFEPDGVEREREQQGDEVVTTEREIEQCRRCGTERVVSESTEVTAVVDGDEVGIDDGEEGERSDPNGGGTASGDGAVGEASDRTDSDTRAPPEMESGTGTEGDDAVVLGDDSAEEPEDGPAGSKLDAETEMGTEAEPEPETKAKEKPEPKPEAKSEPPDPESEDAEILTEESPSEREPGEWPEADERDGPEETSEADDPPVDTEPPGEESLSGITVPEGEIVCPDCSFRIDADSGYRNGDPCPECNAWLEAERNQ